VSVRGFHKQMTFMVKSFFFVFIGAMLGPPWLLVLAGVVLGGVLFVARIPAVIVGTFGSLLSSDQKRLVTVSMPRGMAAGVLATLPLSAGVPGTGPLPVLVFACVFTTILVFAVGFPLMRAQRPTPEADATATAPAAPDPWPSELVAPAAQDPTPSPPPPDRTSG
jgi:cell volume regulation protein A